MVSLHRFNLLGRQVMLVVARDVAEERRLQQEQVESLQQIQQNMEQFQILNDQIRNPVQVIIGLADMEGGDVGNKIIRQAYEIDEIVRQLDVGWLESAKVSACCVGQGAGPEGRSGGSPRIGRAPRIGNPTAASGIVGSRTYSRTSAAIPRDPAAGPDPCRLRSREDEDPEGREDTADDADDLLDGPADAKSREESPADEHEDGEESGDIHREKGGRSGRIKPPQSRSRSGWA